MHTEDVPIYTNYSFTQMKEISQLHRGGKTVDTEEVHIYTIQSITL